MQTLVTVVHVFTCILLVLVVLIQSGKGAEISTSFGGSSQTVFGSSGGANFFTRFTAVAATVFMVTSVTLTLLGGQSRKSLFEGLPVSAPAKQASPSAPAGTGANKPSDAHTQQKAPDGAHQTADGAKATADASKTAGAKPAAEKAPHQAPAAK